MQAVRLADFTKKFLGAIKEAKPIIAQIELTYCCNLKCIHCYLGECSSGVQKKELNFNQWKKILDQIHREGCIYITLTGGEPLMRKDFFDIYTYAKKKGFVVSILTNGILLDDKAIDYLKNLPPFSIEITLNGITQDSYESITCVKGAFRKIMAVINKLLKANLPLVLKANGLKQNKHEILRIKAFAERLLGKHKFKFDSFITPCLYSSASKNSTGLRNLRLSPEEIQEIEEQDNDMLAQRISQFHHSPNSWRSSKYLYHCNCWQSRFFINPYGRLKFCLLTDKYSTDLTKKSFRQGFYETFPHLLNEKFRRTGDSVSKCVSCELRSLCLRCPARAFLETGDEESAVEYYCELAKMTAKRRLSAQGLQ